MNLYGTIGESNPTYLLAKAEGADKIGINIKPGNGTVKRGTVCFKESTGLYSPAAAADAVITKDLVILDETVVSGDAPASGSTAVAEAAAAYRAGHFVEGRVTLKNDTALTDAVKLVLRVQGIVFEPIVSASTFNNEVTGS